jgi:hypothetical protein
MTTPATTSIDTSHPAPLHSDISQCAADLWVEYGRPEGRDVDIWLEAERRLLGATKRQDDRRDSVAPAPLHPERAPRLGRRRSQVNVGPSPSPPAPKPPQA